jgi:uncharacterized membrane protein
MPRQKRVAPDVTAREPGHMPSPVDEPKDVTLENVRQIAALESSRARETTPTEALGLAIARFAGTLGFAVAHVAGFTLWILWNTRAPVSWRIDPFPFGLFTIWMSMEGVLLATFLLIAQNRLSRDVDRRDRLHLQVSLLSEREVTAALRLLRELARRMDVAPDDADPNVDVLAEHTRVDALAEQIDTEMAAANGRGPSTDKK